MSLNIIIGKPKTGKSSYIYEKIEQDIKEKKEVILFVPSQLRQETENRYMDTLKKDGIIGVNITTISEYIKDKIIHLGLYEDEKYISKQNKKMILADVISKSYNKLNVFKSVSKKEGFLDLVYMYIDLFRKSSFDTQVLDNIDLKNKMTSEKLKELAKIYDMYIEKINAQFMDSVTELNLFVDNISKFNLTNTNVYFDSYNNFTEGEFEIIKVLLKYVCDMYVTITTDITKIEDIYSSNTNDMFEVSNSTYLRLLNIANSSKTNANTIVKYITYIKQKEDIKLLAANIFENNKVNKLDAHNVFVNIYTNTFDEVLNIASVINRKIREGYRYKDIDIYTTDIQKYKDLVTRIFFDTKIPVYIDSKENIVFSKLTLYIQKYLELLNNGLKIETAIDILKTGFTDIILSDIYEFENYVLEFNIKDYYITREFKLNNKKSNEHIYDLDSLNILRKKIIDMYSKKQKEEKTVDEYINNIYKHLKSNNIFERYGNYLKLLENKKNEFDIAKLEKEKQVWDKLCEIFDSISKVYKEKISFDDFCTIFNYSLKDTTLKASPPVIDSVKLVDINLAKMSESKIAFFVGVNEGAFPKDVEEDLIFSDEEINSISNSGISFKETTTSKQNMGMYNIYQTLNSIKEQLYITIPNSDFSGKALRPSEFISDIKKILNIQIRGNVAKVEDKLNLKEIYSKKEIFEYMVECLNKNINIEDVVSIYEYVKDDKIYCELLEYCKNDNNLKDETLKMMYNESFNSSVSKLELFKKCPFSYYMKYLLKIEPRKEFQISSLDIGSFMHEVLESFSKYLLENNILWHTLLLDTSWEEKLYSIIEEKLDKNLGNKKQSIKYEILKQKLINTMKKVIIVIAKGFNQSEFLPYGYEIEFKEGSLFAPMKIQLDNNKTMNIVGKIDRVDTLKLEEKTYVRIVDYKSSKKDLKLDDIKEGISIQLVTYLASFIENMNKKGAKEDVLPAGMLYFNLSDKLVNLKDYTNDEEKIKSETIKALRMRGIFLKDINVIEKMDNKIENEQRLIDISKSTLKKDKTNKALELKEYNELFKEAKNTLKDIGKEIVSGVVKIRPNKKTKHCEYCNYSSICRRDSCL